MNEADFSELKRRIADELTPDQCVALERYVRHVRSGRTGELALRLKTDALSVRRRCPWCGGTMIVKHGVDRSGRQRFRCRDDVQGVIGCGRTFNTLTKTPLARMRKPALWIDYVRQTAEKRSIAEIQDSGIDISRKTAFRWRHRLLAIAPRTEVKRLQGMIEIDETFFRQSFKGSRGWKRGNPPAPRPPRYRGERAGRRGLSSEQVPVMTALDRSGGVIERVLTKRSDIEIMGALAGRIEPGSVVCSDGLKVYVKAAVTAGSEHRRIARPNVLAKGGKPRKPGRLSLGRVNSHHARLKADINVGYYGVSTRCLPSYLGLLRMLRSPRFHPEQIIEIAIRLPPTV
jgi:transposase-like protein